MDGDAGPIAAATDPAQRSARVDAPGREAAGLDVSTLDDDTTVRGAARTDPASAAEAVGLVHVSDDEPGIRRVRRGTGFGYRGPDGTWLTGDRTRARFEDLAIPPAWTDVWICRDRDGHLQATGRDDAGRKQHIYHPRWRDARDAAKFARLCAFPDSLTTLRDAVDDGLRQRSDRGHWLLALVVSLLDRTLIRIGNQASVDAHDTYGLTTLLDEHVTATTATATLAFDGKGGTHHEVAVTDRRLVRAIAACAEEPGQQLFSWHDDEGSHDVDSTAVNAWLQTVTGDPWTARDFRVWGGTVAAATALAALQPQPDDDLDRLVLTGFDAAAEALHNTRAVARASYVHPAVAEAFRAGELPRRFARARARRRLTREESAVAHLLDDHAN